MRAPIERWDLVGWPLRDELMVAQLEADVKRRESFPETCVHVACWVGSPFLQVVSSHRCSQTGGVRNWPSKGRSTVQMCRYIGHNGAPLNGDRSVVTGRNGGAASFRRWRRPPGGRRRWGLTN